MLVVAALVVGFAAWALVQRGRGVLRPAGVAVAVPTAVTHLRGEHLTLVQISSEHCSACVRGARVWRESIADRPGVGFAEIDASEHMELVRELGILTTPTTLVYDRDGALLGRVAGALTPSAANAVLVSPDGVSR